MHRRSITYARVYDGIFHSGSGVRVNAWACARMRRARTIRTRLGWSSHVLTVARTQEVGRKLWPETLALARRQQRMCELAQAMAVRKLQRRLVEHLWRPGGALFLRDMPNDFITSTPGAATA